MTNLKQLALFTVGEQAQIVRVPQITHLLDAVLSVGDYRLIPLSDGHAKELLRKLI